MHTGLLESESDMENPVVDPFDAKMSKTLLGTLGEGDGKVRCCGRVLSNQTILAVTCLMFLLFVVAEIIGALVSYTLLFCLKQNCIDPIYFFSGRT
jgi:hypothetical protein